MPIDPVSNPPRATDKANDKKDRLHPARTAADLLPLRKAPAISHCHLYWIPVSSWPIPLGERQWLVQFLSQLNHLLESPDLRGEFFLDYHVVKDVDRQFQKAAIELMPFLGLARRPSASLPNEPTQSELREAAQSGQDFDVKQHMPTYCYWFLNQDIARFFSLFFGYGGSSMIYFAPDPNAIAPKIPHLEEIMELFPGLPFAKLEAMNSAAASMSDEFLKKSKALFGAGLEGEPVYDGLPFIVPLLQTSDFTGQPPEEREKWYEFFKLHWRESPPDRGIFVASTLDVEEQIIDLLQRLKEAGQVYPVGS